MTNIPSETFPHDVAVPCGKVSEAMLVKIQTDSCQREATHRTVWSFEPDTMVVPSGLMDTAFTSPACPWSVHLSVHLSSHRSHMLAMWDDKI